jgi:uncharacterized delta-60 repeat protein
MSRFILVSLLILVAFISKAQPGNLTPSFNLADDCTTSTGSGFSMWTHVTCVQPDGKILVGGNFIQYNSLPQNKLIRLNPNGTIDESFNIGTGADYDILAIEVLSDGKILIGGGFTTFNGFNQNSLIRLNSDGSVDPSFVTTGSGFDNLIHDILIQPDGKILIGGEFDNYNGVSSKKIIRLNNDATQDVSFNPGSGFNNSMRSMILQPDGKIILTGPFTSYNGTTRNRIIRLNTNGTLDGTFNPGSGFSGATWPVHLQSDGKIIVAGGFGSFNGVSRNRIARLNSNGTLDTSFDPGTGFFESGGCYITGMAVQPDGKIITGGTFTSFNGTPINRIARINTDGTLDTSFDPGTGANDDVTNICILSSGKILIGGWFTNIDGNTRKYFARLHHNGTTDLTFAPSINHPTGFNKIVTTIVEQSDLKILVGGDYTEFNGSYYNRFCRLHVDGQVDSSFNTGFGFDSTVFCSLIQADGQIIVGGSFTMYNGNAANGLTRLATDGTFDLLFNIGTGFDDCVFASELQSDGKIIVAGNFTSVDGVSANRIARLNTDGSVDASFNTGFGFNGEVRAIKIQSDGKIVATGDFTEFNGITANKIARLNTDGTIDLSFVTGAGFDGEVFTIAIQNDGSILVGGTFNEYDGNNSIRVARISSNGSFDNTLLSGIGCNDTVYDISLQQDGKIILSGAFSEVNGSAQNKIARLNADGSVDSQFITSTGFDNSVFTVIVSSNAAGNILAGGNFNSYDGICRNKIASLISDCSGFTGSIDPTVNQNYSTLSSVETMANFQWLDCNNGYAVIPGATTGVWSANTTGTFAVEINKDGCLLDTSLCLLVLATDFYNDPSYTPLTGEVFALPTSFPDSCDAIATAYAEGGISPYSYEWITLQYQQEEVFADSICAGIHSLKITDNIGDSVLVDFFVTDSANFYYWYDTLFTSFVDTVYVNAPNCLIDYALPLDSAWINDSYYLGPDTLPQHELFFIEIAYFHAGNMYTHQDTISVDIYGTCLIDFSVYCPSKSLIKIKTSLLAQNIFLEIADNSFKLELIRVFPNPANSSIQIIKADYIDSIEIVDISGRVVYQTTSSETKTTVDITEWESGIYLIQAKNSNQFYTCKFVKN